jgi:Domain of unknown function (DUF4345)
VLKTNMFLQEKRLLQICVVIGGAVPVSAGLWSVLFGSSSIAGDGLGVSMDSHFRYLSGLLLAIGLGFWSTVPRIETRTARFRLLTALVIVGGLGRVVSLLVVGAPSYGMLAALVMELGVTPLLCLWQARVTVTLTRT